MFQCFVICPFGSETRGDEEKRLFDQLKGLRRHVFKATIAECKKRGYEIRISDSREIEHGCRQIQDAVQKCIDEAAAVIVLLTADKPNVYLELGWAQGMWQAPIRLTSDGYKVPVDINNDLDIRFTDAQVDGTDKAGVKNISKSLATEVIKRITFGRTDKQFKHWPPTTLARGAVHVYNRFSKAITPAEWSSMIEEAETEIIFASTSMLRTLRQAFFVKNDKGLPIQTTLDKFLLKKAQDGIHVTILFYHEDNMTIGHLKRLKNDLEEVRKNIKDSFDVWSTQRLTFETTSSRSEKPSGSFRVIQIRRRHLPFRITLTERRVLATLRFYTEIFNSGLTIDALRPTGDIDRDNMPVYTQIKDELDYLIAENSKTSEDAYQDWVQRRRA